MKLLAVLSFSLVTTIASAQLKQKTADQLYSNMEYSKCVEMYDELSEKCFKGSKNADWENVRKSALSHYHLFQMDEAVFYFEKLKGKNMLTEADRMHYINALRYSEMYGKSNEVIRESASLHPENEWFRELNENSGKFNALFADSSLYQVHEAPVNSGKGDFAPAYYGNSLVYVSKAENTGFINPKYGWDDAYYLNIMQANMPSDSTFGETQLLKGPFVSRAHDGPVSFTPDNNEMVITRNRVGKKSGKPVVVLSLYFSKFENGEWSEPVPFEFNNEDYNVGHGIFSPDGQQLYFVSDKPGGHGAADIYVSERLGSGWGAPKNLGATINTSKNDMFPYVQDGILYFASEGHFGLGGLDIFEVNLNDGGIPQNLGAPVNSSHDDFGLIYDKSGTIGFFSSNRGDNVDRIYQVKKRKFNILLDGTVVAQYADKEPVAEQIVWMKNMVTQELKEFTTDANGNFSTSLRYDQEYRVYTKKDEFILLKEAGVITNGIRRDSTLHCELVLKPTTIQVHLRVVEKETGKIIPDATTNVTDYAVGWDTTMITNAEGMVTLTVDRNKVYWAHGAKKGYIDADISFNSANTNDKVIDLELELPPIKKGEKFKLENIFYDLNKSTLRPESKSSLDKLADFIIKNNLKIELSAHTDSRGSNSYNQRLSQARAQSCVDYLISKGVSKTKITARGYGETQLVNGCKNGVNCSEEEHQENRRTEVKILEVQ